MRQIQLYLHEDLCTLFTTITDDTSINAEKLIVLSSTSFHVDSSETPARLHSRSVGPPVRRQSRDPRVIFKSIRRAVE